jgi:23S rRNA pseudouridine2605 synthase
MRKHTNANLKLKPARLQKVLSALGFGSRRQIEQWIRAGQVLLNGRPARLGDRWQEGDQIKIKGRPVKVEQRLDSALKVLLYHKPAGEIVTRYDPQGRPSVFERLPKLTQGRWVAVGRLDLNTEGLMLFTNCGEFAHRLMHPSFELEREYAVRVYGRIEEKQLAKLLTGIELEDGLARFLKVEPAGGVGANRWYRVVVKEGRNRLVRRLWEACGVTVSRLIRIRYGPICLPPGLRRGDFCELKPPAIKLLEEALGE